MPDDNDDYEVGYARPPRHSRFVKGHSGNPRGRPRGAENIKSLLNEALNELVVVTDHGGRRKVSKRKAFITQIVNSGAKGNFRAVPILLAMLRDFGPIPLSKPPSRLTPRPTGKSFSVSKRGSGIRSNDP
jgi:hypothetical protein